jgi:hypothetical protein
MASYTLIQLKKFAARLRGEGFSLQRGEAKKLGSRKNDISLIFFAAKIAHFFRCAGLAKNVIMGILPKVPKSHDFEA